MIIIRLVAHLVGLNYIKTPSHEGAFSGEAVVEVGDQQTVTQTFERVRQSLIRELGQPTRTYDEGDFSARFIRDVNEQRLIRITEWNTYDGVIRFGIPRRLDGQVRMEIQRARSFPPPGDTLWSIEPIK